MLEQTTATVFSLINDMNFSKIQGRRNWVIKIRNNTVIIVNYGDAKRRGLLSERLVDIFENDIHWFYFTYKKDAFECLNTLKKQGYNQLDI